MTYPTFDEEKLLWKNGFTHIAGVDEVGRGCFAGPVVTAAVILPQHLSVNLNVIPDLGREDPKMDSRLRGNDILFFAKHINDSKLLSPKLRIQLAEIIKKHAVAFSISEISVSIINKIGIGKATQQSFREAIKKLAKRPDYILIDAFYIKHLSRKNQKPIIHGDALSITIAAASIIAKVYRDELMQKLHPRYEMYDFATNKGYGTKKHQEAIKKYGLSKLHRKSFDLSKFVPKTLYG